MSKGLGRSPGGDLQTGRLPHLQDRQSGSTEPIRCTGPSRRGFNLVGQLPNLGSSGCSLPQEIRAVLCCDNELAHWECSGNRTPSRQRGVSSASGLWNTEWAELEPTQPAAKGAVQHAVPTPG
ncbi:Hypothetical predicted protein [Marmota monax]|uniref:Uncharacterized protein n=1 Tax=Marmota monax TaxID=9995 RepID=A0A5E4CLF3_MARMO|nr:Hypothetical predicted protein [Marmota monax]